LDGNSQLIQLEAENGTLENVEIAAGAITMPQVVTDNIWGRDVPVPCGMLHNPS
jgi:glutaminase